MWNPCRLQACRAAKWAPCAPRGSTRASCRTCSASAVGRGLFWGLLKHLEPMPLGEIATVNHKMIFLSQNKPLNKPLNESQDSITNAKDDTYQPKKWQWGRPTAINGMELCIWCIPSIGTIFIVGCFFFNGLPPFFCPSGEHVRLTSRKLTCR